MLYSFFLKNAFFTDMLWLETVLTKGAESWFSPDSAQIALESFILLYWFTLLSIFLIWIFSTTCEFCFFNALYLYFKILGSYLICLDNKLSPKEFYLSLALFCDYNYWWSDCKLAIFLLMWEGISELFELQSPTLLIWF